MFSNDNFGSYAIMKILNDCEELRWTAEFPKDIPQNGSVDSVICLGLVDENEGCSQHIS